MVKCAVVYYFTCKDGSQVEYNLVTVSELKSYLTSNEIPYKTTRCSDEMQKEAIISPQLKTNTANTVGKSG